jgi:hypothetical protein
MTPLPISDVSRARAAYTVEKGNPVSARQNPCAVGRRIAFSR